MPRHRSRPVQIGDRFMKLDCPNQTWIVVGLLETGSGLKHARMKAEGPYPETRIISVSTLSDPRMASPITAE